METWLLENTPQGRRHAGYPVGYLDDHTVRYRAGGVLHERQFVDAAEGPGGEWTGPGAERLDQPSHLAPGCRCGWLGPARPYHPQGGRRGDGRYDGQGQEVYAAWQAHATAVLRAEVPEAYRERLAAFAVPLGELADERPRAALVLARQLRELADHLEPLAAAESLAHGVPWETIGTDLGQSKQAAHGRYVRSPSADLERRVQSLTGGTVTELLDAARTRRPGTPPPGHTGWPDAVARILHNPAVIDWTGELGPAALEEHAGDEDLDMGRQRP
ncbi:hypothetical protein [Streptomyces sp. NPDC001492]